MSQTISYRQWHGLMLNAAAFSIIGSIDGTFIDTTQPILQRYNNATYSGHHKHNGANVMCFVAPDGLIHSFGRCWPGHANDVTLWYHSALFKCFQNDVVLAHLRAIANIESWIVFGDSIFPNSTELTTPHKAPLNVAERARSKAIAQLRVYIELSLSRWKNNFRTLQFAQSFRWLQQPLDQIMSVALLLENCRVCIEQTSFASTAFHCPIPTLHEYLTATLDDLHPVLRAEIERILNECEIA